MFLYNMFLAWLICFTSPIRLDSVDVLCCEIGLSLLPQTDYCIALISKRNFENASLSNERSPDVFCTGLICCGSVLEIMTVFS